MVYQARIFFIKSDIDLLQQFYWYVAPYVGVNQRFDFIQIGLNSILISMEQMLLYMSAKLRSRCNEMITIICNRNRILHIKDCDTEIQKELYTTIRQGLYNVLACNDKDLAAIKWSLSIAMPRSPQIKLSQNPLIFLACTRTAQEKKATPP